MMVSKCHDFHDVALIKDDKLIQVVPKINLNQIKPSPTKSSHMKSKTSNPLDSYRVQQSRRGSLKNKGDFELLKMNVYQLPSELEPERAGSWGKRNVIHVNKRPDREPFYIDPDKNLYLTQVQ